MPCFLNVIVGSKSVRGGLIAQSRSRIVNFDHDVVAVCARHGQDRSAWAGSVGGVFEQVRQDALHEVGAGIDARAVGSPAVDSIRRGRCAGFNSAMRSVTSVLTSSDSGLTGGSLANSENARTRPSSDLDFGDDNLRGLLHEGAVGGGLTREHFLDGEANRRQRILQLVRRLSRERLPARHLRQVHDAVAVRPELLGHVVERVDGASNLVVPAGFDPSVPIAARKVGQSGGQLLNRPAHPMRDEHERNQRDEPHERRSREEASA